MKRAINKNLRRTIIIGCIILIAALSGLFAVELTVPKYLEAKTELYKYSTKGSINYKVVLKPNILYSEKELDQGATYITAFTDSVRASFQYDFSGGKPSQLKGSYEILAVVEGMEDTEKNYVTSTQEAGDKVTEEKAIWRKEYVLVPSTALEKSGKNLSITREVSLSYPDYNGFAQKVIDISKVSTPTRLVVTMNAKVKAETEYGPVEENVTQFLTIPLGKNSFTITKNESAEKPGAIEQIKKVQLPVNKLLLIIYGAAAAVCIAGLLLIVFLTKSNPPESEQKKILSRIFKVYGNRLVALTGPVKGDPEQCRVVRTMEDLIRIADEVQKPVLYVYDPDSSSISKFLVYDENWLYLFDLWEYIENSQKEKDGVSVLISRNDSKPGTGEDIKA